MTESDAPRFYTIRVSGRLEPHWADWFDGMHIHYHEHPHNETVLSGHLADQAALHGILQRIRDLNLSLVGVERAALAP